MSTTYFVSVKLKKKMRGKKTTKKRHDCKISAISHVSKSN